MVLNFMGPPGAGKGTQAKIVEDRLGIVQISTGDMLRDAVSSETNLGLEAKSYMNKGELVPDSVVIGIIEERITKPDCKSGFILDGFPRTSEQASALDDILGKHSLKMNHVIYFDVPDAELIKRLLKRAEDEGRADDNIETIENRLKVFQEKTKPVLDYYDSKNVLKKIEGTGKIEEISQKVSEILGK